MVVLGVSSIAQRGAEHDMLSAGECEDTKEQIRKGDHLLSGCGSICSALYSRPDILGQPVDRLALPNPSHSHIELSLGFC